MDTGFIQANTAASGASGGDIQINAPQLIVISNQQPSLLLGGEERRTFTAGSRVSVIQAAAPDGVSGNVELSSPLQDLSSVLLSIDTSFDPSKAIGDNPCDVFSGEIPSSLTTKGKGNIPPGYRNVINLPMGKRVKKTQRVEVPNTEASLEKKSGHACNKQEKEAILKSLSQIH